jgi:hypothetical protein
MRTLSLELSMPLRIQDSYTVPDKTAEVARAIFPKGNLYLTLFDTLAACLPIQILLGCFLTMVSQLFHPSA